MEEWPIILSHDKCIRDSNKEVALKFLGNSPNPTEFVINEVEKYLTKNSYTRDSNREVVLKLFVQFAKFTEFVIDEAKKYSMKNDEFHILYGISQDPDTNDYVLVQKNFTWIGKNEKIDCFIQERLLKINKCEDVIFEWITI
ncbi:hypothetical protein RclHR1_05160003 [Rhizophagus clarus]|uniref:Uncharacterized protein n=1 Tax=Rhizophagus clarus TaxID=94130 RepID=A0A2Z6RM65_9GLOM|nr:hypothetical protein RclHR1_05160003 [Rhizophagus clarus]